MTVAEEDALALTHDLLGTKRVEITSGLFYEKEHVLSSVYRSVKCAAGRHGRKERKGIPDRFKNLSWAVDTECDTSYGIRLIDDVVSSIQDSTKDSEDKILNWKHSLRGWRRDGVSGTYKAEKNAFATFYVLSSNYVVKKDIYFKNFGNEIKEGSIIAVLKFSIQATSHNVLHYGNFEVAYLFKDGVLSPIVDSSDEFIRLLLPEKTYARIIDSRIELLNEDIKRGLLT